MLKKSSLKQKGFTLIELLVAMAIAAVLLTAIVTLFRTSIHMNSSIDNQTNATNQLKNAFNYIDRDAEEAGSVVPTNTNQFPLTLKWIQNNLDETIIYSISNSGLLQRYQYQSGVLQSTMNVANYVNTNSAQTNCTWDNTNYVLTVNMTVSIGAINTSRQFIITPRVVQGAISLATSITTMSATPTPSGFGQSVMFTAVVTGSSGTPTGIVTFFDNGTTQLGTGNLSGGQASYSTSSLSQGSHSITAAYSGDAQYNQSTSSVWTQTVNQTSSSTAITSSANPSTYGSSVTFIATVAPSAATGMVTFKDGSTTLGTGTLSSGTATYTTSILTVGGHSITAVYGGDTNDAGSTSSALSQTVNKGSSSVSVTSSANPSIVNSSVTFTAIVSGAGATSPSGMVTFKDGSNTLGTGTISSGQTTFTTSSLSQASHSITAVYNGDSNYTSSTSPTLTQNVEKASSTTIISSLNPSTYGSSVTFTATVSGTGGTPTGTVTFMDGSITLGTGTLGSGHATYLITTLSVAGSPHSITAVYGGDSNFGVSTSSPLNQTITVTSSSTTVVSSSNPSTYGSSVTFTATVTPSAATGTVTFKDGSTTLGTGTLSSGQATYATSALTVTGSPHSITAVYGGDANDASSTSTALTQTVNKATSSTTVSSSSNPSTFGSSVTFTATVTPSAATGTVTFKDGSTTLGTGTLSGGVATYSTSSLSVAGSPHSITAAYGGDTNDANSTSSALSQTVNGVSSSTAVTSTNNPSTYGSSVTFTATVSGSGGTPTGTVTFKDGSTTLGTGTLSSGQATYSISSLTVAGSPHSITAVYGGDSTFAGSTSSGLTQTVNQVSSSTTVSSSSNPSTYGSSVTFTATVTPSAATGTVTFMDGVTTLGTGNLSSGQATYVTSSLSVAGSPHSITVVYGGDANDASSTSTALTQTVGKAASSTSVASSNNPSTNGSSVTFTATVTPSAATGTVTFMDGATTLGTGTLSSGQAIYATSSLSVAGSPHSITAVYGGDANYGGSTSSVLSQNVTNVTATFGITTTGSSTSTNLGDSTKEATTGNRGAGNIEAWDKFTTTAPLTITSFTIYQNTAGSGHMHVGLYIDSSGPSQLVAGSDSGSISVSNSTGWVTYSYGTAFNLPAGTYWIVFTFDTAQSNFNERNTTGTQYYKLNVGYGSLPASFPSGSTSTTNGPTSMYFTGTQVKGYAEATQVTLSTNNANISSLSFYSYSTGNARLAIYSNSGSAPSSLQWQSNDSSISIGWNTINISSGTPTSLTLQSGTYWLAWQWNSVSSGPSYSTGSNNSGNYIVLTYGSFPATWSGGTSTTENWSIYASYH